MKYRAIALAAGLLAAHTAANAWFFFLPIGAIQNAVYGSHCVPAAAKPGDRINVGGRLWTVVENNGQSSRCSQYPALPNIAKMEPYYTDDQLKASVQACLRQGATVGTRTSVPAIGEVEVQEILSGTCSDVATPVTARVVRVKGAELLRQEQAPPQQAALQPVKEEAPRMKEPAAQKSVADRLRDLKALRDQDLITQEVYESQQRQILSAP